MTIQADLALLPALSALVLACAPPAREPELPLCPPLLVAAPDGTPPPPSVWLAWLLRDYDPAARAARSPLHACSGDLIAVHPDPCEPGRPDLVPLTPLDDRALVFGDADPGELLVWITTHRAPDGDAVGPVALVSLMPNALGVQALGVLEAPPHGAFLSLLDTHGPDGARQRFLVAEGDRCRAEASTSPECEREARILPLSGRRFVPSAYYDTNARCVDPPRLPLHRTRPWGAPGSTVVDRRLIAADAEGLVLREELEIFAGDRLLRRAAEDRRVDFSSGRLTVRAPSLWSRLVAETLEPTP